MFGDVFAPYSARTWLCLLVAALVFSAIFALQERGVAHGERVLVGGAHAHGGATSVGGRVTGLGISCFLVLVVSSYVASLTRLYVTSAAAGSAGSIQQAIERNLAVCVAEEHATQMARQYPGVRLAADPKRELTADPMGMTKGIRHASDLLGYLDTGVCAAAVAPLDEPNPHPNPHP